MGTKLSILRWKLFQALNAHRLLVECSRNFNLELLSKLSTKSGTDAAPILYALQLRITNHGQLKQVDTIVYNLINQSTVKVSRRSIPGKMQSVWRYNMPVLVLLLAIHVQISASDSSFRQKYQETGKSTRERGKRERDI